MNDQQKENFSWDKQLELIIIPEMHQLQGWFNKYDGLIFQSRGWLVVIFMGILGFIIEKNATKLIFLLLGVAIFFYLFELFWLCQYCWPRTKKFVSIQEYFNNKFEEIKNINLFDTKNYPEKEQSILFRKLLEPTLFYGGLIVGVFIVFFLVNSK
jgi:hypothetical protein